jgi:hypothetical protein
MKRQRGRNRKPGGGGGGGGGGNNPNRAFESNGPEGVKIRGNAQHVYERYQQLARDAFSSGDRVLAENHLQHAEHYFRVLRTIQPQRPVSEIAARDAFASGFDIDFEDETGMSIEGGEVEGATEGAEAEGGEAMAAREGQYADRGGQDRGQERGQDRGDYRRDREFRGEGREGREGREFREGRDRDNRDFRREPRPDDAGREPREYRGEGEGRRESRRERFERRREERRVREGDQPAMDDPMAVVEPRGSTMPQAEETQPAPRAAEEADSHLPAFLRQAAPATPSAPSNEEAAAPARKPARRRKAASAEEGEGGTPEAETADEQA